VIRSFADKDTERVFNRERVGRWSVDLQRAAQRKLVMLDAAEDARDRWRICFRWSGADAYDVEITDYH
jgi:proteic killer suppression protein